MHRGKLTIIVCGVENLLSPCVLWKTSITVCTVENLLTSWFLVHRRQTFDIVCGVENILHRVFHQHYNTYA